MTPIVFDPKSALPSLKTDSPILYFLKFHLPFGSEFKIYLNIIPDENKIPDWLKALIKTGEKFLQYASKKADYVCLSFFLAAVLSSLLRVLRVAFISLFPRAHVLFHTLDLFSFIHLSSIVMNQS